MMEISDVMISERKARELDERIKRISRMTENIERIRRLSEIVGGPYQRSTPPPRRYDPITRKDSY